MFSPRMHSYPYRAREQADLLQAMSPLLLASKLPWADDDVATASAGGDESSFAPSSLPPLSEMSREEQHVRLAAFVSSFNRMLIDPLRDCSTR